MKKLLFYLSSLSFATALFAQSFPPFPNGGFENWNGSGDLELPDNFHSNKDGSSTAQMGPKTAFKEISNPHSGSACVRIETKSFIIAVVNGSLTTGYVNAPNTTKSNGYIGTTNFSDASQVRRIPFAGRPDSLVGYFKYTPGNDAAEKGKISAVLHHNQYYDPETPTTYHPDPTVDRVGRATFVTDHLTYGSWTRFSVPFNYDNNDIPDYVLITATSSENQTTGVAGSKFWLDDLEFIYNIDNATKDLESANINIYKNLDKVMVDMSKSSISGNVTLIVADLEGKEILHQALNSKELNTISMPTGTNNGVYIFKIIGNTTAISGKLAF